MNEQEIEYLNNSILKPYLIHVEFEVENIITKLITDKKLRELYVFNDFPIFYIENKLREAIKVLNRLQQLFRIN